MPIHESLPTSARTLVNLVALVVIARWQNGREKSCIESQRKHSITGRDSLNFAYT